MYQYKHTTSSNNIFVAKIREIQNKTCKQLTCFLVIYGSLEIYTTILFHTICQLVCKYSWLISTYLEVNQIDINIRQMDAVKWSQRIDYVKPKTYFSCIFIDYNSTFFLLFKITINKQETNCKVNGVDAFAQIISSGFALAIIWWSIENSFWTPDTCNLIHLSAWKSWTYTASILSAFKWHFFSS